jgi:hypothetical protein
MRVREIQGAGASVARTRAGIGIAYGNEQRLDNAVINGPSLAGRPSLGASFDRQLDVMMGLLQAMTQMFQGFSSFMGGPSQQHQPQQYSNQNNFYQYPGPQHQPSSFPPGPFSQPLLGPQSSTPQLYFQPGLPPNANALSIRPPKPFIHEPGYDPVNFTHLIGPRPEQYSSMT